MPGTNTLSQSVALTLRQLQREEYEAQVADLITHQVGQTKPNMSGTNTLSQRVALTLRQLQREEYEAQVADLIR
jgi:hypothetical protein